MSLNEAYHDLGEKTFKGLRRALPMTRQKLDWERVSRQVGVWPFTKSPTIWPRRRVTSWAPSLPQAKVASMRNHDPLAILACCCTLLYYFKTSIMLAVQGYRVAVRCSMLVDCVHASIVLSSSSALASRSSILSSHRYTSYL